MGPTATDGLRLAALVSVIVAAVEYGWLGFALFFLVFGGVMVPRALGSSTWLDACHCTTLLLAAWSAQLDFYLLLPGLDVVAHAVATGLVATIAWQTLVRTGALPGHRAPALPRLGAFVTTLGTAMVLAVAWEFGEWAGHTWIDDRIQVGYDDTIADLAAGMLGALAAAVLVSRTPAAEPAG